MSRVVIFANGQIPDLDAVKSLLRDDDFLLAADAGARHILALGLVPSFVIGDFDSLTEDEMYELGSMDVRTHQYPADKDETDLELALQYAQELRPNEIMIVGALGGRFDQTLANISLITDIQLSAYDLRLNDGAEEIYFCRDHARVKGRSGDIVSLIPWGGEVSGVVTENLKWALTGETLFPYRSRGVSNEMLTEEASIKIKSGLLLVVHRLT